MHNPPHSGTVLREYVGDVEQGALALQLGVARQPLSRMLNGHASITADMALKLQKVYPKSRPEFWLKMQTGYDFWLARQRERRLKFRLKPQIKMNCFDPGLPTG